MPATLECVPAAGYSDNDDQDFIDAQPATTRAVVCGFLSARAELYSLGTALGDNERDEVARTVAGDAAWARERFESMRSHPAFARMLPAVRSRVEALIAKAGDTIYTITPRQVVALAAA